MSSFGYPLPITPQSYKPLTTRRLFVDELFAKIDDQSKFKPGQPQICQHLRLLKDVDSID